MAANTDLFDLIHSLSKSEKRYFRRFASLRGGEGPNKYERLFELIDQQKTYDEDAIRKELKGDPMERNISAAKYYLYNALMRSLHAYHTEHSQHMQASIMIHEAEILLDRKLYDQAAKMIAKVKDFVIRYEFWHLALEISRLEFTLAKLASDIAELREQQRIIAQERRQYLDILDNLWELWDVNSQIFIMQVNHHNARAKEHLEAYNRVLGDTIGKGEEIALSRMALIYHYDSRIRYYEANDEMEAALNMRLKELDVIRSSEPFQSTHAMLLTGTLLNICIHALRMLNAPIFFEHYEMLMNVVVKRPDSGDSNAYIIALFMRVEWYSSTGDYDMAVVALAEAEQVERKFKGKLIVGVEAANNLIGFHALFGVGRHRESLNYLNKVGELRTASVPEGLLAYSKILALVVHVELGNFELLEYLVASTRRFLQSRRMVYKAEDAVFRYIRELIRACSHDEQIESARTLLGTITALADDPLEGPLLRTINMIAWVESRITGERYAAIVRRRYLETGKR